ncbi:uncharacterized protein LOC141954212 [Strix uralensis]|uniref:uncharacterized protein LOC141954212 n=1 Tax=Strix uralensis TaxID=36305 RepID=UPI003DA720DA
MRVCCNGGQRSDHNLGIYGLETHGERAGAGHAGGHGSVRWSRACSGHPPPCVRDTSAPRPGKIHFRSRESQQSEGGSQPEEGSPWAGSGHSPPARLRHDTQHPPRGLPGRKIWGAISHPKQLIVCFAPPGCIFMPSGWSCPAAPPAVSPPMSPPSVPASGTAAPTAGGGDRVFSCTLLPVVQHPPAPPINTQRRPRCTPCAGDKPGPRRGACAGGCRAVRPRHHQAAKCSFSPPKWAAGRYPGTGGQEDGFCPPGRASVPHGSSAWSHRFVLSHVEGNQEKTHFLRSPTCFRDSLKQLLDVKPRQRDASPPRALKAD